MKAIHTALFLTTRGERHQRAALAAAPANLQVIMLREPPRAELLRLLPQADFLISERAGTVDRELIAVGSKLRLIQRLGSLAHDIDLAAARAAGVPVSLLPVGTVIRVAEHMLMLTLALAKRLTSALAVSLRTAPWRQSPRRTDEDTFAYNWSGLGGIGGLYGRSVGILGCGEIGVELARRVRGLGPAQLYYSKRQQLPRALEQELGLTHAPADDLIAQSEFLCNLLPYSAQTDLYLNAQRLAQMPAGACLISCGSGSVIDEGALAQALLSGHLAGAALDTFEWEPLPRNSPLLELARDAAQNLLLTPHIAAGSAPAGSERHLDYVNIVRLLRGEPILHRIA